MAPKRSAAPPPPDPPAPVASSEETASGSGSEEEDEEAIAHSPPPAARKSIAPLPQKGEESEASDEDEDGEEDGEDDDEEEEEDEKAKHVIPSATKDPPPPPQKDQESEASGEDEDGEEDDEEEEEDEKANHVIPAATKNPPPPAREESGTSDEEEEEEEAAGDEVPQTKPAPNQEMTAKGAKRRGAPFQRTWSTDDEFRILEFLAAHRQEHGTLPQTDVLANALAGKLDKSGCNLLELKRKLKSMHSRNSKAVKKGAPPSNDRDRRFFDLCNCVWPSVPKVKVATKAAVANSAAARDPDEMRELYPYLAEEVEALQKAHPGLFKREFGMIDDSKARALEEKIKKQKLALMNVHLRRHGLTKEVTKALMDLTQ